MNEAETRAELIDPALKAAGWGVVEANRVQREVIALGRQLRAGKPPSDCGPNVPPSSLIHGQAIIRHPARDVRHLVEYVGDHQWRPGLPREPVAMRLIQRNPYRASSGYGRGSVNQERGSAAIRADAASYVSISRRAASGRADRRGAA